jgi:hypothetical protein
LPATRRACAAPTASGDASKAHRRARDPVVAGPSAATPETGSAPEDAGVAPRARLASTTKPSAASATTKTRRSKGVAAKSHRAPAGCERARARGGERIRAMGTSRSVGARRVEKKNLYTLSHRSITRNLVLAPALRTRRRGLPTRLVVDGIGGTGLRAVAGARPSRRWLLAEPGMPASFSGAQIRSGSEIGASHPIRGGGAARAHDAPATHRAQPAWSQASSSRRRHDSRVTSPRGAARRRSHLWQAACSVREVTPGAPSRPRSPEPPSPASSSGPTGDSTADGSPPPPPWPLRSLRRPLPARRTRFRRPDLGPRRAGRRGRGRRR